MSRRPTYAEADAAHRRTMAAARVTVDAFVAGNAIPPTTDRQRGDWDIVDRYRAAHPGWRDTIGNRFADLFDGPSKPQ